MSSKLIPCSERIKDMAFSFSSIGDRFTRKCNRIIYSSGEEDNWFYRISFFEDKIPIYFISYMYDSQKGFTCASFTDNTEIIAFGGNLFDPSYDNITILDDTQEKV